MHPFRRILLSLAIVAVLLAPHGALACATCFGQSDSKLAEGMNMGILSLLIIMMAVLGGIGSFFLYIARRAAAVAAAGSSAIDPVAGGGVTASRSEN